MHYSPLRNTWDNIAGTLAPPLWTPRISKQGQAQALFWNALGDLLPRRLRSTLRSSRTRQTPTSSSTAPECLHSGGCTAPLPPASMLHSACSPSRPALTCSFLALKHSRGAGCLQPLRLGSTLTRAAAVTHRLQGRWGRPRWGSGGGAGGRLMMKTRRR